MRHRNFRLPSICLSAASVLLLPQSILSQTLRPFSVEDEIGLAHFGNPYGGGITPIVISPNGALVAVHAERGLLKEDRVQDEVRIYNLEALRSFANSSNPTGQAQPVWTILKSTYKEGLIISGLEWLHDSSGIAFLLRMANGRNQLWLGDVRKQHLAALTPEDQDVTSFDVKDASHFAYTVRTVDTAETVKLANAPAFDATGLSLNSPLLLPLNDPGLYESWNRSELWAADGGKPFAIHNSSTGAAIPIYVNQIHAIYLAPDGKSVATSLAVDEVPSEWEIRYPPPPGVLPRLKAGHQDLNAAQARGYIVSYATIELRTGKIAKLTNAPDARSVGWGTYAEIRWSEDSHKVLLPSAYVSGGDGPAPCIAVATPFSGSVECIQPVKPYREEMLMNVQFLPGRTDSVIIDAAPTPLAPRTTRIMAKSSQGKWEAQEGIAGVNTVPLAEVAIRQSASQAPVLVVTDPSTRNSRVVWNPNPQLSEINLGDVAVYRWKDELGRDWVGGLYKPAGYIPGHRYPLVIQTHGFIETQFRPSGMFPTAFAARALAAQGIVVLQVRDCPVQETPDEGPCQVRGYKSAVQLLAKEGLVDPERIGIIGFSRTCYYVMYALTSASLRFRAASTTDGVNGGYLQYLLTADSFQGINQRDGESLAGARPFADGLQSWLRNSPEFNVDKVSAPLQIVARPGMSTLSMWEPYALLRALNKPVDLRILNTNQHVLTNPRVRLASQGGTVDWFRFWLQDYEDPDPAKKDQYARWHKLRNL